MQYIADERVPEAGVNPATSMNRLRFLSLRIASETAPELLADSAAAAGARLHLCPPPPSYGVFHTRAEDSGAAAGTGIAEDDMEAMAQFVLENSEAAASSRAGCAAPQPR